MPESIVNIVNGSIAVVVVLGACVFFHELGHFTLAKLIGMKVQEFGVGFGRRIYGFTRGETEYRLNLVPLGGYVRIAGMEPGAEPREGGFHSFPRWQGFTVLLAGSAMNVVLAALAFIAVLGASGMPVFPGHEVNVRKVLPGTPAERAGMKRGDRILAIDGMDDSILIEQVETGGRAHRAGLRRYDLIARVDGEAVYTPLEVLAALIEARAEDRETVVLGIAHFTEDGDMEPRDPYDVTLPLPEGLPREAEPGSAGQQLERLFGLEFVPLDTDATLAYVSERPEQPIAFTVLRGANTVELTIVPEREWARVPHEDEEGRRSAVHEEVGRIGVVLGARRRPASFAEAAYYGAQSSINAIKLVAEGIYEWVRGKAALQGSGPVGIAAITAESAQIGWTAVAYIGGIISANLAVINLFPIPPFDGFRIVLLGIEAIIRRRVNEKIEILVTVAGVAVVLGLFLIITFQDIFNLLRFRAP